MFRFCLVFQSLLAGFLYGAGSSYQSGQLGTAPAGWTLAQQGIYQVLRPTDAADARVVVVIGPEESPGDSIERWLESKTAGQPDPLVEHGTTQGLNKDVVTLTNAYRSRGGEYLVVFGGLRKPDGNWQVMTIKCPPDRQTICTPWMPSSL